MSRDKNYQREIDLLIETLANWPLTNVKLIRLDRNTFDGLTMWPLLANLREIDSFELKRKNEWFILIVGPNPFGQFFREILLIFARFS